MQGIIAAFIAGICSVIGAVPILVVKIISEKVFDLLMGFAGGVMIFAAAFQLIKPALEQKQYYSIIIGLLVGTIILTIVERKVPHSHNRSKCEKTTIKDINTKIILFITTMIIHSIPEGFAIGAGYASGRKDLGIGLALAIGIQNIPEGMLFAAYLKEMNIKKYKLLFLCFLNSLGEPISAAIGVLLVKLVGNYLNLILSIAAGAILYVVSHELIPDSHCRGNEVFATYGVILGFELMVIFQMLF